MCPKVSIIVPIYNVEKYLHKCADSILAQTFIDFECILVDDCSTDNSPLISDEYAKKDNRIKVIHNNKNLGVSLSRRKGLTVSQGEYILYIDSDDWVEIDMVEKLYQKAVSENYDITVCDFFFEEDHIVNIHKQDLNSFNKIDIIKKILSIRIKAVLWNKLVKKELYLLAEFPEYNRSEDYLITIQNIYNANKIGYINIPFYHYRFNAQSLTNNIETKIGGCIEENRNWRKVINFLKEKYEDLSVFEPELSSRINYFKYVYKSDKDLKKIRELFKLYPESKFYRYYLFRLLKDIIMFLLPHALFLLLKKNYEKHGIYSKFL